MEHVNKTLESISFDNIYTGTGELYQLYRLPAASGCAELVKIAAGSEYPPHIHDHCETQFIFLKGDGFVLLNGDKEPYQKGSVFDVPSGMSHGFIVTGDTIFLSIQSSSILDKESGKLDLRYV